MNSYQVTYSALNGHRMVDVVNAASPEAAAAVIHGMGLLVTIQSIREVA